MKQKKNSKSKSTSSKTVQNVGSFKEPRASRSKSNGAEEQFYNTRDRAAHYATENAWGRSRHSSVTSDAWGDTDEHFPALGASAAARPKVNVWEERLQKQEEVKLLEPQNQYDEEAMLQRALTMSLLEAKQEEERQKKYEEDCRIQLAALKSSENSDSPVLEQHHASNNSQKETTYDSEHKDDFSIRKQQYFNSARNSASSNNQKEKFYNSRGARPKVNKAIEAFGGWGLKGDKRKNNSTKFIDGVISENSGKSNNYDRTSNDQKNKNKSIREDCTSSEKSTKQSIHTKNAGKSAKTERSDDKNEILYDEKGSFLDDDDDDDGTWKDSKNEAANMPSLSTDKLLDVWLESEDVDNWSDEVNENFDDKNSDNFVLAPFSSDKPKIEDDEKLSVPSPTEFSITAVTNEYEPESIKNSQTLHQKDFESSMWPNRTSYSKQELSENKNVYDHDACKMSANNFTPFNEPTEVPTLTSNTVWSEKSSNNAPYIPSFSDNNSSKLESLKICGDANDELFSIASSGNDSDMPPIPPPQPVAAVPTVTEYDGFPSSDCKVEPPTILQPQPVPEMAIPQFPVLGNPLLNPMFPALNPMMGIGMDPLSLRYSLILSNPYLANQLLAMEQYYRSYGMNVDLFSMASPVSNVPGLMNLPVLQNSFASNPNINMQQLQYEIQQLVNQNDANAAECASGVEHLEQNSCEISHNPPEHNDVLNFTNIPAPVESCIDDSWFKNYLSSDDALIPPPKPPSSEVNNSVPVPQASESSQIPSCYFNKFAQSDSSDNSNVHSSNVIKERPLTAFNACITKSEATGWSDPEDDFDVAQNFTNQADDGWGDIPPCQPSRSLREERKKTVFRQPARQPQMSHYQKNPYR